MLSSRRRRKVSRACEKCIVVYLFHYKDRSFIFPSLCSRSWFLGENSLSLSTLTFHFFLYSFIRFFIHTLLLLLLLFTRRTVGRRSSCIVNDRGSSGLLPSLQFCSVFVFTWSQKYFEARNGPQQISLFSTSLLPKVIDILSLYSMRIESLI